MHWHDHIRPRTESVVGPNRCFEGGFVMDRRATFLVVFAMYAMGLSTVAAQPSPDRRCSARQWGVA